MPGTAGSEATSRANSRQLRRPQRGATTSMNMGGYVIRTANRGRFTTVSESWTQQACEPAVRRNTFTGMGRPRRQTGRPTVEQTGTEADCAAGTAAYQGWFESPERTGVLQQSRSAREAIFEGAPWWRTARRVHLT